MKRSLFGRLFFNNLLVSLMVLVSLSGTLIIITQSFDYNRSLDKVRTEARNIAAVQHYVYSGVFPRHVLEIMCWNATINMDCEVWVANRLGVITRYVDDEGTDDDEQTSAEDIMSKDEIQQYLSQLLDGKELTRRGTFNNRFGSDTLTVAVPCYDAQGNVRGAVFIHTRYEQLQSSSLMVVRQIALSGLSAFMLSVILTYFISMHITRPLTLMGKAAAGYAHGKFDTRLVYKRDDEIGRLAESLNKMAAELKNLEDMRAGFVANVSHELRSPLTSLKGYLQAMADNMIPPEEHPKYFEVLLDETQRMTNLVNDLLDLSKLESGSAQIRKEKVDLNEIIRRVLVRFDMRFEDKHIELEVVMHDEKLPVEADPARMDQVFTNLIDNAVKYVHEGGRVKIWSKAGDKAAVVTVEDNGPGIGQEDLPFVFDRFYKVEKAHTSGKGTGLGLSIVRNIIVQHGGTINVSSTEGKGTAFVVRLPL